MRAAPLTISSSKTAGDGADESGARLLAFADRLGAEVAAGISRVNVSIDSLARRRGFQVRFIEFIEPHATARAFAFADGPGEIGFINPVSEPFCADCNRIRLTADGRLRTCLFSRHETDLRGPLRAGADDAELERIVREAVWRKELKHRIGEPGFRPPARTMSAIGG